MHPLLKGIKGIIYLRFPIMSSFFPLRVGSPLRNQAWKQTLAPGRTPECQHLSLWDVWVATRSLCACMHMCVPVIAGIPHLLGLLFLVFTGQALALSINIVCVAYCQGHRNVSIHREGLWALIACGVCVSWDWTPFFWSWWQIWDMKSVDLCHCYAMHWKIPVIACTCLRRASNLH